VSFYSPETDHRQKTPDGPFVQVGINEFEAKTDTNTPTEKPAKQLIQLKLDGYTSSNVNA
jgi:hypothetical protein